MEDARLDLVQRVIALTEAQLDAARRLDGSALFALNEQRTDALFALRVALQEPIPDESPLREALAQEARTLRRLERRLAHLAGLVLTTLERISPTPQKPPRTYLASGRLTV